MDAGFCVVGCDLNFQRRYPYEFIWKGAVNYILNFGHEFDAIHASPPCQAWSTLGIRNGNAASYKDFIAKTRQALLYVGKPYVIENVVGAPLRDPIQLCGTQFPNLRVFRHRLFESNFPIPQPKHTMHDKSRLYTIDRRKPQFGKLDPNTSFITVTGGGNTSKENAQDAMGGLWWMTKRGCNEALPPAYTHYIGTHLRTYLLEYELL